MARDRATCRPVPNEITELWPEKIINLLDLLLRKVLNTADIFVTNLLVKLILAFLVTNEIIH